MMGGIAILAIYVALCGLVAYGAVRFRRSPIGWFIGAFLFSPVVAGIFLMAAGSANKTCPDCGEPVSLTASRCPYCQHAFASPPGDNPPASLPPRSGA